MEKKPGNRLIMPIDGSANALKALNYVGHFFGQDSQMDIHLLYVMPMLPPILVEESQHNRETAAMLKKMNDQYTSLAKSSLDQGRQRLLDQGFGEEHITTTIHSRAVGVAEDICSWAEKQSADAIVMNSRGRGRLEAFFMGATAGKVVDASGYCPVWILKGQPTNAAVLIAVDRSEEALRAVDHAGFVLSRVDGPITLFYSQRKLSSLMPREVADAAPELEAIWQDKTGKAIAPVMAKARDMLVDAGVHESRITVRVAEGSRSPAADIIRTAQQHKCGTIVLGRRGTTGKSAFRLGSVSRKVMEAAENSAVWIVP